MKSFVFYLGLFLLTISLVIVIIVYRKQQGKDGITKEDLKALYKQNLFFEASTIILLILFLISYYL